MKFKFWSWKLLPVHIVLFLTIFTLPGLLVEYKPSMEMNEKAVFIGLLIGGLSFLVSLLSLIKLSQNNFHLLVLSISFLYLTSLLGWSAANGTVGFLANRFYGHEVVKTSEVLSKHDCKGKRKCFCATEIRVKTDSLMSNGVLCVTSTFWNELQPSNKIQLTGLESVYGIEIYDYDKH